MNTRTKLGGWLGLLAGFLLAAGVAPRAEAAAKQMQITFGGYTNKSEVLTNFPVLVVLSNNVGQNFTFADFVTTNGYDLRFYTNAADTGSGLNYEIESWNTNAGQACYVWVQAPTIPTNGSGSIYAKWGDAANSNQLACTTNGAVWTNGYIGVWHFATTSGTVAAIRIMAENRLKAVHQRPENGIHAVGVPASAGLLGRTVAKMRIAAPLSIRRAKATVGPWQAMSRGWRPDKLTVLSVTTARMTTLRWPMRRIYAPRTLPLKLGFSRLPFPPPGP